MKKFIAYFDILGYKNRIADKSLDEEYRIQSKFIKDREVFIDNVNAIAECRAIHFSDTHIFYTKDTSEESFDKIIRSSLLFMLIVAVRSAPYLPLRGAVSCGDFLVDPDKQTIIGQGLREASLLAEQQQWMGCCLSDSCKGQVKGFRIFKIFLENIVLVNYSVPFKNGKEDKYVINMESFPRVWGDKTKNMPLGDSEFIENIFINRGPRSNNLLKLDESAGQKLKNTQDFFKHIKNILQITETGKTG